MRALMYCVNRWPWQRGRCSSCARSDCDCETLAQTGAFTQVLPCHECGKTWCAGNPGLPDACRVCGIIVCNACTCAHDLRCRDLDGRHGADRRCTTRRSARRLTRRGVHLPCVEDLRNRVRCSACTSILDLAGESCAICLGQTCLNQDRHCSTELRTCKLPN